MHDYIVRPVYYIGVHLFYASLVWFTVCLLTLVVRRSYAAKYWVWVATSLNFVLPLGAVLDKSFAAHLWWAKPLGVIGEAGLRAADHATIVGAVWLMGALVMAGRLCLRVRVARRDSQSCQGGALAKANFLMQGTPVRFVRSSGGPVVNGILRPQICLPEGIDRLLTKPELNAVLLHELTHAKRRDNLIWLAYEIGLCVLWFHPLVWITGSRLALYRELSCDESVVQHAHGSDLVSALTKLVNPESGLLLRASASSFMSYRLERLAAQGQSTSRLSDVLLTVAFSAVFVAGVLATVSHTACCFIHR